MTSSHNKKAHHTSHMTQHTKVIASQDFINYTALFSFLPSTESIYVQVALSKFIVGCFAVYYQYLILISSFNISFIRSLKFDSSFSIYACNFSGSGSVGFGSNMECAL